MKHQVNRPSKHSDLLKRIRTCIENDRYKFTKHALERKSERSLSLMDILYVLKNGVHEGAKDSWDKRFEAWNYAIRGKGVDKNDIRIIVSFDKTGLLIVTVIRLKNKGIS